MTSTCVLKTAAPTIVISRLLPARGNVAAWKLQRLQLNSSEPISREVHGMVTDHAEATATTLSTREREVSPAQVEKSLPSSDDPFLVDDGEAFDISREVRRLLNEGCSDIYRQLGQQVDRLILLEVMNHVGGNQVHAAERLGISRMTLRAKLRTLGLIPDRTPDQDEGI